LFTVSASSGDVGTAGRLTASGGVVVGNKVFSVQGETGNTDIAGSLISSNGVVVGRATSAHGTKFVVDDQGGIQVTNTRTGAVAVSQATSGNLVTSGSIATQAGFRVDGDSFVVTNNGDVSSKGSLRISGERFVVAQGGDVSSQGGLSIAGDLQAGGGTIKASANSVEIGSKISASAVDGSLVTGTVIADSLSVANGAIEVRDSDTVSVGSHILASATQGSLQAISLQAGSLNIQGSSNLQSAITGSLQAQNVLVSGPLEARNGLVSTHNGQVTTQIDTQGGLRLRKGCVRIPAGSNSGTINEVTGTVFDDVVINASTTRVLNISNSHVDEQSTVMATIVEPCGCGTNKTISFDQTSDSAMPLAFVVSAKPLATKSIEFTVRNIGDTFCNGYKLSFLVHRVTDMQVNACNDILPA